MSEDSYNKLQVNKSESDSYLYTRNLGMTTPVQKRIEKAEKRHGGNMWLVSGVAAGF